MSDIKLRIWVYIVLSVVLFGQSACEAPASAPPALTPVTVQLRWTHNAQFAGLYAADRNGYYADEGLAVSFVEGGPAVAFIQAVVDGDAQFGITNADGLILARAAGIPVRAIATIYRRNPTVYMALGDSGITRPQDFAGKRVRVVPASLPILRAMMARAGLTPDDYTEVAIAENLEPLFAGEIDVSSGFVTNEVLVAQAAGKRLNLIFPDDYGVHFYSDTIFTTDQLIAENPDLITRFLRATLRGWVFAVENPAAIGPMVQHYNPQADVAMETQKMTASLPLVNTGEDRIGSMKPEMWAGMEQTLREQNVLTRAVDIEDVYTLQFLQALDSGRR